MFLQSCSYIKIHSRKQCTSPHEHQHTVRERGGRRNYMKIGQSQGLCNKFMRKSRFIFHRLMSENEQKHRCTESWNTVTHCEQTVFLHIQPFFERSRNHRPQTAANTSWKIIWRKKNPERRSLWNSSTRWVKGERWIDRALWEGISARGTAEKIYKTSGRITE